jgi:hypothetical protein
MVLARLEVCDILWERAGWAFVFLWLGVAYAAEGGGHGCCVDAIGSAMRLNFFALDRVPEELRIARRNVEDDVPCFGKKRPKLAARRPKAVNPRGELRCPHHSTEVLSNRSSHPNMSFAAPLRNQSLRALNSWTCASCARSLPRTRNTAFTPARRWLTTTKESRQSHVPRMDQMHARYKEKNRTVAYATPTFVSEYTRSSCSAATTSTA